MVILQPLVGELITVENIAINCYIIFVVTLSGLFHLLIDLKGSQKEPSFYLLLLNGLGTLGGLDAR